MSLRLWKLNRYLDELEEEYKNEAPSEEVTEGCETQNVEDVVVEEKPIEEPKVEVEEDETISNPRPNNLALPSQEGDDSTKSVIDLVGWY